MELFSMGLRYQFLSTPPVIYAHHQGTQLYLLIEMFGVDRRNGQGHLYFGVDIILVKHHVNQQWVQTGWLPTAEDGVGLLWNIRKLNVIVEDQF